MTRRGTYQRPAPSYFGLAVGSLITIIVALVGFAIYLTARFM